MSPYSSGMSCPFESLGHGRASPDVSICHLLGEDCCPNNRPTRSRTCPPSLCRGPLRYHTAVRERSAKSVTRFLALTSYSTQLNTLYIGMQLGSYAIDVTISYSPCETARRRRLLTISSMQEMQFMSQSVVTYCSQLIFILLTQMFAGHSDPNVSLGQYGEDQKSHKARRDFQGYFDLSRTDIRLCGPVPGTCLLVTQEPNF